MVDCNHRISSSEEKTNIAPDIQLIGRIQKETLDRDPSHGTEGKGTPSTQASGSEVNPQVPCGERRESTPYPLTIHTHIIAHEHTHKYLINLKAYFCNQDKQQPLSRQSLLSIRKMKKK